MVGVLILSSILIVIGVIGSPQKRALENECKYNNLASGTYRCILPDEGVQFLIDCMVDGTMYIYPKQQSLYHYHKQSGLEMKFKLIASADYYTLDDVDDDLITNLNNNDNEDGNNEDVNNEDGTGNDEDSTLNEESLESEELTETEKHSVNLTAQYIVYTVIIVMAVIFSVGICLLIYWWCCHKKTMSTITELQHGNNGIKSNYIHHNVDETAPFIDIRSPNTIKKQKNENAKNVENKTIYFENEECLERERHNVYDAINNADDDEDGDELIAHYGATSNSNVNNDGYIIAKHPNND